MGGGQAGPHPKHSTVCLDLVGTGFVLSFHCLRLEVLCPERGVDSRENVSAMGLRSVSALRTSVQLGSLARCGRRVPAALDPATHPAHKSLRTCYLLLTALSALLSSGLQAPCSFSFLETSSSLPQPFPPLPAVLREYAPRAGPDATSHCRTQVCPPLFFLPSARVRGLTPRY